MTAVYPSYPQRRRAAALARGLTIDAVRERREEARRFLAAGITMVEKGLECGADLAFLQDTASGMHDVLTRIMGQRRQELDNAGADERDADLYLSELDALIGRLS